LIVVPNQPLGQPALRDIAVGIFIVNGAIGLAFEQRRPVVRTLRALGVPLRRLVLLMACELAVFALIAGLLGVVYARPGGYQVLRSHLVAQPSRQVQRSGN